MSGVRFEAGGFSVCVEEFQGWGFVHSLEGSGDREALGSFLTAVMSACEGSVLVTTAGKPSKRRFYERLGFRPTGEEWGGHAVLLRHPIMEVTA